LLLLVSDLDSFSFCFNYFYFQAKTVNGKKVAISVAGSVVKINDATVVATDIECDNGVIHVVDSVIIPR